MQHHFEWNGEGKDIRPTRCGRLGGHEDVEGGAIKSKVGVPYHDRNSGRGVCRDGKKNITGDVLDYQALSNRDGAWTGREGPHGIDPTQYTAGGIGVDRLLLWVDCLSVRRQETRRQERCHN